MAIATKLFDLTGKVALLTGASKGIGLAMAEGLAEHGAQVVVSSRKLEQCQAAAESINARCGPDAALPLACNAGHKEQLENLVQATRAQRGRIDILVCNAAANPYFGPMLGISDAAFDKIMAVNLKATHWLCHMVAPEMAERGEGSILVTSSIVAFSPSDALGVYGISKVAALGLVRNLALELGPKGVRVNAICPGLVKTDFARALWENEKAAQAAARQTPLRRLGAPEDLKGAAVFLASPASAYMTGQALTVCGGTHMCR